MIPNQTRQFLRTVSIAVAAVICGTQALGAATQPRFTLVDLGLGTARAINNKGQVVGTVPVSATATQAVLWENGVATYLTPGAANSEATAISNNGLIAGNWISTDGTTCFVYKNGVATGLPRPSVDYLARANGINDQGWVAGTLVLGAGVRRFYHGALWKPNAAGGYTLYDLDPPNVGYEYVHAVANGINNKNVSTGAAFGTYGAELALWTPTPTLRFLGNLSSETYGMAINDLGHICGYYTDYYFDNAFLWRSLTAGAIFLGDLGGGWSRAAAINRWDDVVGYAGCIDQSSCAALWSKGRVYELNTLIPPGALWQLWEANGINDSWSIVGSGTGPDGLQHAYLLERQPSFTLTLSPGSVFGGAQTAAGTLKLDIPAGPGGFTVQVASSLPGVAVPAVTDVTILEGATSAAFAINSSLVSRATLVTMFAETPDSATYAVLTVKPLLTSVSLSPTTAVGGVTSPVGTVKLGCPAPAGGVTVTLGSTNTLVAAPAASSVFIPAGATTGAFAVVTQKVLANKTVAITASFAGRTLRANLTVTP